LREVVEADLPVFYEYERDREAAAMAVFPPRERDAFMAHWEDARERLGPDLDGRLRRRGRRQHRLLGGRRRRFVGYWIGRKFWGRGLPTQALAELLDVVDARPLHAYVVKSNVASIRVLEKCGFVTVGEHAGDDGIEELLLELRA